MLATETAIRCSRANRAVRSAYYCSFLLIPWIWATVLPLALISVCFIHGGGARFGEAVGRSICYKVELLGALGPVAILYVIIGNLTVFGIAMVSCWCLTYVWAAKRVYCVLTCALLSATVVEWSHRYPVYHSVVSQDANVRAMFEKEILQVPFMQTPPFELPRHMPLLAPRSWETFIWSYHPLALLAIPAGALLAMLPIFKPGARYYLRRGLCPKCEYDLRGKTDAGCPECGWNRPAAAVDHKAIDHQAAERKAGD